MTHIYEILSSSTFWFGAVLLCAHQTSRFNEMGPLDTFFKDGSSSITNLKAGDFSGRTLFLLSLVGYVSLTFILYLFLCSLSPTVINGYLKIVGQRDAGPTDSSFVLYIATALMGISQIKIPGLSNIDDTQRNLFYYLAGIPQTVVNSSEFYFTQIMARCSSKTELGNELRFMIADEQIKTVANFGDEGFYRTQIERLRLDSGQLEEILQGSQREIKTLIRQLIYALSLAAVRKSGRDGLSKVAQLLSVHKVSKSLVLRYALFGFLICLIAITLVWTLLPILHDFSDEYLSNDRKKFWPVSLFYSGQYLFAQAFPLFIIASITSVFVAKKAIRGPIDRNAILAHFVRYSGLLVWVVILIVAFDTIQAVYDFGVFWHKPFDPSILSFIPIYILHSMVALALAVEIILCLSSPCNKKDFRAPKIQFVFSILLLSSLYCVLKVWYQYHFLAWDFIVLVVAINVGAALLAEWISRLFNVINADQNRSINSVSVGSA